MNVCLLHKGYVSNRDFENSFCGGVLAVYSGSTTIDNTPCFDLNNLTFNIKKVHYPEMLMCFYT
ncbi:UNVERIFIED_CONTAM: hypothetical protein NCL1_53631 [Trichonephila clavipes]